MNGNGPDPAEKGDTLSEAEVHFLFYATAFGSVDGCTEGEARTVIDWAHRVRVDATLLDLVLTGAAVVSVDRGGATDGAIRFRAATPDQEEHLRQVARL